MSTKRLVGAFYAVVLVTALAGSTSAAAHWLGIWWVVALAPVAAVELGGVVLSAFATDRRKLGEPAIVARALSAGVAGMAVAVNVFGHEHVGQAAFFGGMSALGYAVYLLLSAAKRRDALRAAGKLEDTAPPYGLWQWLRHPDLTRRARILAQTKKLGKLASLDAAREQVRSERRRAGLAREVRKLIAASAGKELAGIAVDTFDMDAIADRLADRADYDGITNLLAARLTADKLAGGGESVAGDGDELTAVMEATAPTLDETVERVVTRQLAELTPVESPQVVSRFRPTARQASVGRRPRRLAAKPQPVPVTVVSGPKVAKTDSPKPAADGSTARRAPARKPATTADKVAAELAKKPGTQADVAKRLGVSLRTVERYWPKQGATAVNGSPGAN